MSTLQSYLRPRSIMALVAISAASWCLTSPVMAMGTPGAPSPTTHPEEYCADRDGDGYYDPAECVFFEVEGVGSAELYDLSKYVVFRRKNLNLVDNCPQDANDQTDADGDGVGDPCEYTDVTAGANHACGIRADGTVHCWGDNSFGQAQAPTWNFLKIAAGDNHTCGLLNSTSPAHKGVVLCWGDNRFNQLGATNGSFDRLRASGDVTCAITQEGRAKCWGACGSGSECAPPSKVIDIAPMFSASNPDSDTAQTGLCLASAETGSIGLLACNVDGATPLGGYFGLDGDDRHACALKFGGAISCWGQDEGDPVLAPPTGPYSFIAVGSSHACAVGFDRQVTCWGNNSFGKASAPAGKYEAIAVGDDHSCAVAQNGAITCWGDHGVAASNPDTTPEGILFGSIHSSLANKLLPRLTTYNELAAKEAVSCGLTTRGKVTCSSLARPSYFVPQGKFIDVRVGEAGVCATRSGGATVCWDEAGNMEELLGVTHATTRRYSERVNGQLVDRQYLCGIYGTSKKLFCRDEGQPTPAEPDFQFGPTFKDIGVMGQRTVCGLTEDKRWLCQDYRAGSEVEVKPGLTFEHLECATGSCCATSGYQVWCRDATGSVTQKSLARATDLAVAESHRCVLSEGDRRVACYANAGDTSGVATPPSTGRFYELSAGNQFSCALKDSDAVALCWGQLKGANAGLRRDYRGALIDVPLFQTASATITRSLAP